MMKCKILLALALLFFADKAMARSMDEHIYLVPVGQVDKKVLEYIKSRLPDSLPVTVKMEVEDQKNIPDGAYDPSRKQYNAEVILNEIAQQITIEIVDERALLITDVDLYAQGYDFVLGVSDAKRGIGMISLARLKNEFYGLKPDNKLFLERALKEATREFGYSRGLDNCTNPKCVMHFSKDLSGIDKKKTDMCRPCRDTLYRRYNTPLVNAPSLTFY